MSQDHEHSLKYLKSISGDISILFVEDNEKLREQTATFLEKFFPKFFLASNGEEGLKTFEKERPKIIITDLKMPLMDGFSMIKAIREIDKDVLILILSAFKDIKHLSHAIELEVFRYLGKPISVQELSHGLIQAIERLNEKEKKLKFEVNMQRIFNYQSSLIFLLEENELTLANERFLNFFDLNTVTEFNKQYPDISELFLEQRDFFFSEDKETFMTYAMDDLTNVYNAKLKDLKGNIHHFILSIQRDLENKSAIFSLNDVTSLDFLPLFDIPKGSTQPAQAKPNAIYQFLEQLFESGADLQLFNTYKGLPITNKADFNYITEQKVGFTSSFQQIKAISLEERTLLYSELLPQAMLLNSIDTLNMDKHEVIFELGTFISSSAMMRETIRLIPNDHVITLLQHNSKLPVTASIKDISTKAIRISSEDWMQTLENGDVIQADMVFTVNRQKIIVNCDASIFRMSEKKNSHEIILILALNQQNEKILTQYLLKRQMELIREFKGRANE